MEFKKNEFSDSQLHNFWSGGRRLRCKSCSVCVACLERPDTLDHFNDDAHPRHCSSCIAAGKLYKCDAACAEYLPSTSYDESHLKHSGETTREQRRVCKSCMQNGYSAKDVTSYACTVCDNLRGRGKFTNVHEKIGLSGLRAIT